MAVIRKPFQGVWNIIRFNRHFYILSFSFSLLLILLSDCLTDPFQFYCLLLCLFVIGTTLLSLLVSYYVYDLSGFYNLNDCGAPLTDNSRIVNINAGFDETSILLRDKYPVSEFMVADFYDPLHHTELSIRRARKAYPPFPGTFGINTTDLALRNDSVDKVFLILAAHEIRNMRERNLFFGELRRILKPGGQIIVSEHLRDLPNFIAYTIGFFHFYSRSCWLHIFAAAGLIVQSEAKHTPFITTFILEKNGNSL